MKKIFLLIILSAIFEISAQTTRPANIEIPITVWDNSGMQNSSRVLTCGIDSMATDSIDSFLDEFWILCPFASGNNSDCPPYDHFEAVFDIPVEPDPNSFEFGSWKDFRYGEIPFSGIKDYTIYYLTHQAASTVNFSWDFPEDVSGLLLEINYTLPDSGTFSIPSTFGHFTIRLTYQNSTPVELISFNGFVIENKVQLIWSTVTETNNSGFEIQRSEIRGQPAGGEVSPEGGKSEPGHRQAGWEKIGFVPGIGTTIEPKSYTFMDNNLTAGNYKYRLKQIDFDGTFNYSKEIEVEANFTPAEFILYQNYPNPFNPGTTIKFSLPEAGNLTLTIYNTLGQKVAELVNSKLEAGNYNYQWNAKNAATGIYIYELRAGVFNSTKKMLLLK